MEVSGSQLTEKNALWKTDQSDIAFVSRITFERTIARIQRKKNRLHTTITHPGTEAFVSIKTEKLYLLRTDFILKDFSQTI